MFLISHIPSFFGFALFPMFPYRSNFLSLSYPHNPAGEDSADACTFPHMDVCFIHPCDWFGLGLGQRVGGKPGLRSATHAKVLSLEAEPHVQPMSLSNNVRAEATHGKL